MTIREYREKLGWSQEALARRLNVSLQTVWRWEKGTRRPNNTYLNEIKRYLKEHEESQKEVTDDTSKGV